MSATIEASAAALARDLLWSQPEILLGLCLDMQCSLCNVNDNDPVVYGHLV
jgi:hypothetical protein